MRAVARAASCLMLVVSLAQVAHAQVAYPSWMVGDGGGALLPGGTFADHADASADLEMFLAFQPSADRPWGARLTSQFASFAASDTTYDLPGVSVETQTSSQLVVLTLGPQWVVGSGPLRGVLHAGGGVAWTLTKTAIRTATNDVGDTNLSDAAVAWEAGGALSWRLMRSGLLSLEVGGRWISTGSIEYVPESGIQRGAGALHLTPRRDPLSGVVLRAAFGLALDRVARR